MEIERRAILCLQQAFPAVPGHSLSQQSTFCKKVVQKVAAACVDFAMSPWPCFPARQGTPDKTLGSPVRQHARLCAKHS
eukprot:10373376-Alexandrium_andersonii.AAC.1